MAGKLIVFEGADASGKTTQAKMTADALFKCGYNVVLTRQPGGDRFAEAMRDIVLDPSMDISPKADALAFAASRAQHVEKVISPALAEDKIVVCDRYIRSSLVYQVAMSHGRLTEEDVLRLNLFAVGDVLPDLEVVLNASDEVRRRRHSNRGTSDRMEQITDADDIAARFRTPVSGAHWPSVMLGADGDAESINKSIIGLILTSGILDDVDGVTW